MTATVQDAVSSGPGDSSLPFRETRARRLRFAVATSFLSKASTAFVQFFTIILVGRTLGIEGYAAYSGLLAFASIPMVFSLRLGADLVSRVSKALASEDVGKVRALLWSSFMATATINAIVFSVAMVSIFFANTPASLDAKTPAGYVSALTLMIFCNSGVAAFLAFESCQAAYQENGFLNLRTFVGNLLVLTFLTIQSTVYTQLWLIVLSIHFPLLVSQIANCILFVRRHPELRPTRASFSTRLAVEIAEQGFWFSFTGGASHFLCHQAPVLFATQLELPSAQIAYVACSLQLILQWFSVCSLIVIPFMPAISDGLARSDFSWMSRSIAKVKWTLIGWSAIGCTVLVLNHPYVYRLLLNQDLSLSFWDVVFVGLYAGIHVIENFYFNINCSLRKPGLAYRLYLLRAVVTTVGCWVACTWRHPSLMFVVEFVSALFITTIPFIRFSSKTLRSIEARLD
jgi:O-antigen/teichoic acid export membrane protein